MAANEIETLMNDWIQRAVCCQVRVLRFSFLRHGVPPLDLACLTLLSEHLTKLELTGVAYQDNLDLSGCPALQDMKLEDCYFLCDEIQAPYLKHLTMKSCGFFGNNRTLIRLQSLISLKLTECHGSTPFLASMPSLATAVVMLDPNDCDDRCNLSSVDGCGREICGGCRDYYVSHIDHTICLLLNGLSDATNLELSTYPPVVFLLYFVLFS
jgi:hypothetical protein